jgi:hypothetical protein
MDFIQKVQVDWVKPNTCNIASCFIGGDRAFPADVVEEGVVVPSLDDDFNEDGFDARDVVIRLGLVTTSVMIRFNTI